MAKTEPTNSTAVAARANTLPERPSFIKEGSRGAEEIQRDEIRPPSLRLAQSMSPEVKRADPAYLDGLREGDLFNSLTREVYGDDPVHLLIIKYLGRNNVVFDPNDRTVVLESNIPDDDPRCAFTVDADNKKHKPEATTFKDFLILLIRDGVDPALMTLTLKGSQLKKAGRLLTLLATSKLDTFAHLIKATPIPEHKGANSWYGWRFDVVGYPTEAQYFEAEKRYQQLEGLDIVVPRETEVGEADAGRPVTADDDIPF